MIERQSICRAARLWEHHAFLQRAIVLLPIPSRFLNPLSLHRGRAARGFARLRGNLGLILQLFLELLPIT